MRVVGGRLRGRNLASPSSREIRPTADRLRESVFNILIHAYDNPIEGEQALAALRDGGWLTPGALLVVEEAKAAAFATPDGFEELERRAYDDTEFVFLRR